MTYPKWVYSERIDVTRANKKEYDKRYNEAREIYYNSGYNDLPARERYNKWDELRSQYGL